MGSRGTLSLLVEDSTEQEGIQAACKHWSRHRWVTYFTYLGVAALVHLLHVRGLTIQPSICHLLAFCGLWCKGSCWGCCVTLPWAEEQDQALPLLPELMLLSRGREHGPLLGSKHSFLYLCMNNPRSPPWQPRCGTSQKALPLSQCCYQQQPAGKYLCQSQTLISITAESTFMISGEATCLQRKPEASIQLFWVSVVPGRKAEENLGLAQELETHHEMAGAVLCYTQLPMICGDIWLGCDHRVRQISQYWPNVRNHQLLVLLAPTQLTDTPLFTTKPN